jgi:C-terminal processing protease CtpA/Prc
MKWISWVVAAALVAALAVPALAGSGEKCTYDTQSCLNHWSKGKDRGWVGLQYDKSEDGTVKVKAVTANSPAVTAGFQVGDVVVAVNGARMSDKDAVKKATGEWKVGQKVSYTVLRAGGEKQLPVTLGTMPEEVFASMVGSHMLENHAILATADAKPADKK